MNGANGHVNGVNGYANGSVKTAKTNGYLNGFEPETNGKVDAVSDAAEHGLSNGASLLADGVKA